MNTLMRMMIAAAFALSLSNVVAAQTDKKEPPKETEKPKTEQPADAAKQDDKKAEQPAKEQLVYVQLETSMGNILLELNQTKAPLSTENFVSYVNKGHYNGTVFHRVIKKFMIQGGGFDGELNQKPTDKPIKNEWKNGLKNEKYTIACARTAVADSATSQFYINVADNNFLDQPRDGAGYAVFGKVVAGTDVVDKIAAVKTVVKKGGQMPDVPEETVSIKIAKVLSAEEAAKARGEKK